MQKEIGCCHDPVEDGRHSSGSEWDTIPIAPGLAFGAEPMIMADMLLPSLTLMISQLQAIKFIEQGHIRVGTEVITDPAFLVTRNMEDFVTWVDSSRIKRNILQYRDKLDDFDLL